MKGQVSPAMEMRGTERRGRSGMERESLGEPGQGDKGHSDPAMAFQGSGRGKTVRGVILQPFLSAVLALCLLFLCFNPTSFTCHGVKFVIPVSVYLDLTLQVSMLLFSLEIGIEN